MWKRKRAKNNGEYFEEDQVWENLPYQRPKFIIKLHRLRVWYKKKKKEYGIGRGTEKQINGTDRTPKENLYHSHGNTDHGRKAEWTTQ